ncbi:hypothetical protein, partial [Methanothrix sp.]|uniref:hypothetical protein n=1 Tax=Methanothrix sp. TaxID=90426 RepID=UPI003BB50403
AQKSGPGGTTLGQQAPLHESKNIEEADKRQAPGWIAGLKRQNLPKLEMDGWSAMFQYSQRISQTILLPGQIILC